MQALLLSSALVSAVTVLGARPALAADAELPAASAPGASTGLEEVTVTARKRDENLQSVPVSATVVTTTELKQMNLTNFYDLRGAVPDLTVTPSQGGSGVNLSIRGVGAAGDLVQSDPKVGLYVDEMFIARPEGNSLSFFDQAAVQVLYGPQGTLFGRNTSGGAFLVTTNRPTAAPNSSYVQVTYGNYDTINTEGAINVPISDTLLTRFSFRTENAAGYITHALDSGTSDNINDKTFRGQVRWTPTDKFTADLLYEHGESKTDGSAVSTYQGCNANGYPQQGYLAITGINYCGLYTPLKNKYEVYGGAFFMGPTSAQSLTNSNGQAVVGGDWSPSGVTPYYRGGPFDDVRADTFNLRLSYALTPDITIKSITTNRQYGERDYSTLVDAPVDPYQQYNDQGTVAFSQELNVTGKSFANRLNWVAGFYYYRQDSKSLQFDGTDFCDPAGWNDYEVDKETSYAGYVQASYDLTSKLELTAGGRFTYDWKSALGSITAWDEASDLPGCDTTLQAFQGGVGKCANNLTARGQDHWTNFNPMGSIQYKITPSFSIYGTIRSSYDEGGFNAHSLSTKLSNPKSINGVPVPDYASNGQLGEFDPDHFTDYEVGLKTEWLDHTLRVNVDVYYQKYADLVSTVLITVNGISTRNSQNAGDAHYDGFEGSVDWAPTRDFRFSANGYVIDGHYDKILPAAVSTSFNLNTPLIGVGTPSYGWSVNGSYTFHPYQQSALNVSMNYKAQGATLGCQVGANYTCTIPGYGLLGGNATFQLSPDSPWTVGAYVTNLLNSYWLISRNIADPTNPIMGIDSDTPGAPRKFGMFVKRTF